MFSRCCLGLSRHNKGLMRKRLAGERVKQQEFVRARQPLTNCYLATQLGNRDDIRCQNKLFFLLDFFKSSISCVWITFLFCIRFLCVFAARGIVVYPPEEVEIVSLLSHLLIFCVEGEQSTLYARTLSDMTIFNKKIKLPKPRSLRLEFVGKSNFCVCSQQEEWI